MLQAKQPYVVRHPQAVAWTVVLAGFLVFCTFCIGAFLAAYWFVFQSQINMNVTLTKASGNINVTLPDNTENTFNPSDVIGPRFKVSTIDNGSQGYLTFQDDRSDQAIATIFLLSDSSLFIDHSDQPRFEWSSSGYSILLKNATGHLHIRVWPGISRTTDLRVQSDFGEAHFFQPGDYDLDIFESTMTLASPPNAGIAELRTTANQTTPVNVGSLGTLVRGQMYAAADDLPYKTLNVGFGTLQNAGSDGWQCYSRADRLDEPPGVWSLTTEDDRTVLRLIRKRDDGQEQPDLNHAESGCSFTFNVPADLTFPQQYSSLNVRAIFKIKNHNVQTCGIQGSECPIMIRLDYLNEQSVPQQWFHGFYTRRNANDTNPLSCSSCFQDHARTNQDTWFIYDSGDLLKLLPDDPNNPANSRKPMKLLKITVYSSGHLYDAVIGDVSLVAGAPSTDGTGN